MKCGEEADLKLKKEKLSIIKKENEKEIVNIYTESYIKNKKLSIPILHQDIIIEEKEVSNEGFKNVPVKKTRIPYYEEKINLSKQKEKLQDISIYKEKIKDMKHIEENLKKEEEKILISGSLKERNSLNNKL